MIRKTRYASQLREEIDESWTADQADAADAAVAPLGTDDKAAEPKPTPALEAVATAPQIERGRRRRIRQRRATLLQIAIVGLCALIVSFVVVFLLLSPERRHDMLNQGTPRHIAPISREL